jgi:Mg-chelatase subunit ChlD
MVKNIEVNNGIKIIKSNKRAVISQGGIMIQREGRPIQGELAKVGFVYLVVDCSVSMDGEKLNQAKKGAFNFAKDALAKEYYTGLVRFESVAAHLCEPMRDIETLHRYLQKMEVGGSTNMAEAIRLTTEKLKDKAGFRVMVIVTDGMPDNSQLALEEAQEAKNNRIDIITIGTDDADEEFLKKLASRTDLNVMVASNQLERGIASAVKMLPQYGKKG